MPKLLQEKIKAVKKMTTLVFASILAASMSASACVMISSSAISDRAGNGAAINSSASEMGILHLMAPQGLTQTANNNLLGQCATGKVTGVSTELSMRDFLIVQLYNVSVNGNCI
jgi:hypothetical protein